VPVVADITQIQERLEKALSHPLRVELLRLLTERTYSPNELAQELQEPLGRISYHVRVLDKTGCIELVDEKQRRGAVEHYYRGVQRPLINEAEWAKLTPEERSRISCLTLQNLYSESLAALQCGSLDSRVDRHLTWRQMTLDEEGWRELMALLMETMRGSEEIQARSDERRNRTQEEPISAIVGLLGFERGVLTRRVRHSQ
jgi:DNA-binding transcriptional ArsR family regulator